MTWPTRFPATTPRVSRSTALLANDVVVVDAEQFEDSLRRIVVGPAVSDETIRALSTALQEIDARDGLRRWITDLLAKPDHSNRTEGAER